ncbi:MAG: VWA domain-containing protein, partial [Actinomycetota bacterium]|nr:VWA domain-containing protein [Actinomycetota bacterium]
GEHTSEQFEQFMAAHGEFFPSQPQTLAELVDDLARRAAAQQALLDSLTPEQRQELGELMQGAMDMDLQAQLAQLGDALRGARPDLPWGGRQRMRGEQGMGMGDATTALAELADLEDLEAALGQDYPGASLDDIDEAAVQRALGRSAVDDVAALRRIERELLEQGYLVRDARGKLELSPRAVRRVGATALRKVFSKLDAGGRGAHDVRDAGAAGEVTGASRAWQFGDEQPLDVVRTVRNAVQRGAGRPLRLHVEDFEVVETERRTCAAVALLVDLSFSMELRGTWGTAKQTALALHSLVTTKYPQDSIEIIGFSDYAQVLSPEKLAGLDAQRVQGTNLQHALVLAGRHLASHPDAEPVVLVVTDGEPTAHLTRTGHAEFCWPPLAETLELTMAEVERVTRRGATINVFMLDDEPRLVEFVEHLAARNGGRVFSPDPARLGEYVVSDYLRARRGRRAR